MIVRALLPVPLRHYWPCVPPRAPPSIEAWDFRILLPGYSSPGRPLTGLDTLWVPRPGDLDPPPGAILLGRLFESDRRRRFSEIAWLRGAFPWLSVAVVTRESDSPARTSAMATRLAQRGAVVLADGELPPVAIADAVRVAFVPETALRLWLTQALSRWRTRERERALELLLDGLVRTRAEDKHGHKTSNHAPLWVRVGRALGAALALQAAAPERAFAAIAFATGYHDAKSMDRALRRCFGLRAAKIRGTTGWEWLLWRFLTGLGVGKRKRWDQKQ